MNDEWFMGSMVANKLNELPMGSLILSELNEMPVVLRGLAIGLNELPTVLNGMPMEVSELPTAPGTLLVVRMTVWFVQ